MNSLQLRYLLKKNKRNITTGVFAADQLNHVTSNNFCIVVNIQDSHKPGMHWVSFFKTKYQKYVEFFDSYGLPVTFYNSHLKQFVKRYGGFIRYNQTQLQSNHSKVCGQYCLFMLLHRSRNISFDNILGMFSKNKNKNDKKVQKFVNKFKIPHLSSCEKDCELKCQKLSRPFRNVCIQSNNSCKEVVSLVPNKQRSC
jgi:hypothetical protein